MKGLAPNTPVIVGIGFHQERIDDPTQCAEPYQLMVRAVRNAARDAGREELLTDLAAADSVLIPLQSDYLAMRGAQLLMATIEKVRKKLNPKLTLLGVLVTMYNPRTGHARDVLKDYAVA